MIDFRQVKDVIVNSHDVLLIYSRRHNKIIWIRQPEYPYMTIAATRESIGYTSYSYFFTDKCGLMVEYANGSSSMPALQSVTLKSSGWQANVATEVNPTRYLDIGDVLTACCVNNDTEYNDFTETNRTRNIGRIVSDAIWSLSDEETGQIKLYATTNTDCVPDGVIVSNPTYDTRSFFDDMARRRYYPTSYFELMPHDTDVTVDAGTPLITLSTKNGGNTKITSMRTNFDDYKAKYDATTVGKFSKSQYPYLRGIVKIDCKSALLGINYTCGIYLTFTVSR